MALLRHGSCIHDDHTNTLFRRFPLVLEMDKHANTFPPGRLRSRARAREAWIHPHDGFPRLIFLLPTSEVASPPVYI